MDQTELLPLTCKRAKQIDQVSTSICYLVFTSQCFFPANCYPIFWSHRIIKRWSYFLRNLMERSSLTKTNLFLGKWLIQHKSQKQSKQQLKHLIRIIYLNGKLSQFVEAGTKYLPYFSSNLQLCFWNRLSGTSFPLILQPDFHLIGIVNYDDWFVLVIATWNTKKAWFYNFWNNSQNGSNCTRNEGN